MDEKNVTLLKIPSDLARELIENNAAEPYFRTERTDISLIPQILITATTASTTVVVTQLTTDISKTIAKTIGSWWRKRKSHAESLVLMVKGTAVEGLSVVSISDSAQDEEFLRAIEHSASSQPEGTP